SPAPGARPSTRLSTRASPGAAAGRAGPASASARASAERQRGPTSHAHAPPPTTAAATMPAHHAVRSATTTATMMAAPATAPLAAATTRAAARWAWGAASGAPAGAIVTRAIGLPSLPSELRVELQVAVGQAVHGEPGDVGRAAGAQRRCQRRLPEHLGERGGEGPVLARWDEDGVDARAGHGPVPGQVARHDGRPRRHGLEQHDPERLPTERRRTEHVGALET